MAVACAPGNQLSLLVEGEGSSGHGSVVPGCPGVTVGTVPRGSCQALCERKVVSSRLPAHHPVPTCWCLDSARALTQ